MHYVEFSWKTGDVDGTVFTDAPSLGVAEKRAEKIIGRRVNLKREYPPIGHRRSKDGGRVNGARNDN